MPARRGPLLLLSCIYVIANLSVVTAYGPSPEQWASKSILHILTDRFALEGCPANPRPCKDLDNACGGNHIGLRHRLDYIQVGVRGVDTVSCSRDRDTDRGIMFQTGHGLRCRVGQSSHITDWRACARAARWVARYVCLCYSQAQLYCLTVAAIQVTSWAAQLLGDLESNIRQLQCYSGAVWTFLMYVAQTVFCTSTCAGYWPKV